MLQIRNLAKSYEGRKILNRLTLEVQQKEIVIITGKSGSGKTTLLLSILGFVSPDQGEIVLDGQEINSLPIEQRHLAYLPQDYGLFPHLTVRENIAFGLTVRNIHHEGKIRELLRAVQLPFRFADRSVLGLSGGEKQRVALARALAIEPRLFLLDEPLSAIDVETRNSVGKQLRLMIKKLSIPAIIISHDLRDVGVLGDTIYRLERGKLGRVKKNQD